MTPSVTARRRHPRTQGPNRRVVGAVVVAVVVAVAPMAARGQDADGPWGATLGLGAMTSKTSSSNEGDGPRQGAALFTVEARDPRAWLAPVGGLRAWLGRDSKGLALVYGARVQAGRLGVSADLGIAWTDLAYEPTATLSAAAMAWRGRTTEVEVRALAGWSLVDMPALRTRAMLGLLLAIGR